MGFIRVQKTVKLMVVMDDNGGGGHADKDNEWSTWTMLPSSCNTLHAYNPWVLKTIMLERRAKDRNHLYFIGEQLEAQ